MGRKKKQRTVEELEQLLAESERLRKTHLAVRKEQLKLLRMHRIKDIEAFTALPTPSELTIQVSKHLMDDPDIVKRAVDKVKDDRGFHRSHMYNRRGVSSQPGVFHKSLVDEEAAVHWTHERVYNQIQHYAHYYRNLVEFFIDPILNRETSHIDYNEKQAMRKVYYSYHMPSIKNGLDYTDDEKAIAKAPFKNYQSLDEIVKMRKLDVANIEKVAYFRSGCSTHIQGIRDTLIEIIANESADKSKRLYENHAKINW